MEQHTRVKYSVDAKLVANTVCTEPPRSVVFFLEKQCVGIFWPSPLKSPFRILFQWHRQVQMTALSHRRLIEISYLRQFAALQNNTCVPMSLAVITAFLSCGNVGRSDTQLFSRLKSNWSFWIYSSEHLSFWAIDACHFQTKLDPPLQG